MLLPRRSPKVSDKLVLILGVVPELTGSRDEDASRSMDVARESVYPCIGHRQLLNVSRLGGAPLREVAHDGPEAAMTTCIVRHSLKVVRRATVKPRDGPSVLRSQVVKASSSLRLVVVGGVRKMCRAFTACDRHSRIVFLLFARVGRTVDASLRRRCRTDQAFACSKQCHA
jgi:hypothetical protein